MWAWVYICMHISNRHLQGGHHSYEKQIFGSTGLADRHRLAAVQVYMINFNPSAPEKMGDTVLYLLAVYLAPVCVFLVLLLIFKIFGLREAGWVRKQMVMSIIVLTILMTVASIVLHVIHRGFWVALGSVLILGIGAAITCVIGIFFTKQGFEFGGTVRTRPTPVTDLPGGTKSGTPPPEAIDAYSRNRSKIYRDTDMFSEYVASVRDGSEIWTETGVFPEFVGSVDSGGSVYKGSDFFKEYVGCVKPNGDVYAGIGLQAVQVGSVDISGRIFRGFGLEKTEAGRAEAPFVKAGGAALLLPLS